MCSLLVFFCAYQERERVDILEQYRSLSQRAEKFETQSHHMENECSNLKLELRTRDGEIRRLRDKIESLERQVEEVHSCIFISSFSSAYKRSKRLFVSYEQFRSSGILCSQPHFV